MKNIKVIPLVLSVGICLAAGLIGSYFTTPYLPTWYASINKPPINPPAWIFAPVWTTLYTLMGIAVSMIWVEKHKKEQRKKGLIFFGIQLVLNVIWSVAFFTFQSPITACILVVALWFYIFLSIRTFLPISKVAGYLLIPYIAWVSFAALLNFWIAVLN